ncbi:unnamed protein product [Closterium sp. NIES-53]
MRRLSKLPKEAGVPYKAQTAADSCVHGANRISGGTSLLSGSLELGGLRQDFGSVLPQLRSLRIKGSKELEHLPTSITQLKHLTCLELVELPKLTSFPDAVGALSRLQKLSLIQCSAFKHLPASLTLLACLTWLDVSDTSNRSLSNLYLLWSI